jgi:hypothetical protein
MILFIRDHIRECLTRHLQPLSIKFETDFISLFKHIYYFLKDVCYVLHLLQTESRNLRTKFVF